jgi:hypothetical protein
VATVAPPEGSKRSKTKGAVRKRWSGNPEGGLCPHHKHELVWPRRDDGGALSEEEGSEGFGPVVRENVPRQSVLNTKTHHEAVTIFESRNPINWFTPHTPERGISTPLVFRRVRAGEGVICNVVSEVGACPVE